MKKLFVIVLLTTSISSVAQNLFGKNPFKNQQDWDKQRIHYGYFIGFSSYNFKINYTEEYLKLHGSNEIIVNSETHCIFRK